MKFPRADFRFMCSWVCTECTLNLGLCLFLSLCLALNFVERDSRSLNTHKCVSVLWFHSYFNGFKFALKTNWTSKYLRWKRANGFSSSECMEHHIIIKLAEKHTYLWTKTWRIHRWQDTIIFNEIDGWMNFNRRQHLWNAQMMHYDKHSPEHKKCIF